MSVCLGEQENRKERGKERPYKGEQGLVLETAGRQDEGEIL
jgi:hypothetical protein